MGVTGAQVHIAKVEKLDEQLSGCFLNNIIVSCQNNYLEEGSAAAAMTVYLSTASGDDGWSDDSVITARSTAAGGGTVNLKAYRRIQTNATIGGDTSIGPVHVWAEQADQPQSTQQSRFTIEAWGRMHKLTGDGL